jgi:hypothetical protein
MTSDKEMNGVVARIVCIHIFPKLKFTWDSDFGMDGEFFKVCCRHYTKVGGNNEQFKHHWQMKNGWKIARSTINSKRS